MVYRIYYFIGALNRVKKGAFLVLVFTLTPLPIGKKESITYCIILHLTADQWIRIGQKGEIFFRSGFYAYIGSAKKNALSRINRHWLGTGKKKWHIDYLRVETKPQSVWTFLQETLEECELAEYFQKSLMSFVPSFGSSDCHCPSHLFYSHSRLDLESHLSVRNNVYQKFTIEHERGFLNEPVS